MSISKDISGILQSNSLLSGGNEKPSGAQAANTSIGGSGNDTLNGGVGADTLSGGKGNDTYVVDNIGDIVTENKGEGIDGVSSSVNYKLTDNVENLTLTGTENIDGTGNGLNNILTGNAFDNKLDGGLGIDKMSGGDGNDTYFVDNAADVVVENANQGTDTVEVGFNYTLGANVENLTLTGSGNINGTGNVLNNAITGNSGNNILNGGAGADAMSGGKGDDTYIVDNALDTVVEGGDSGTDTVQASVSYAISDNVEKLTLTGTANIDGTGNGLANAIIGNSGNNKLDGGLGTDTLQGGLGNDTYVVDNAGDVVTENAAAGIDSVQASITYTLGNNVENLLLTGSNNLSGTGNALNNAIIGNSGSNTLDGGLGNDTLDGGKGADSLVGGAGNDTYVVDDIGDIIIENKNEGTDSVQASASYKLADNVENLTLNGLENIDGTGNDLNNILIGNSGNNRLDGKKGADRMSGGAGDDTYVVDNAADVVVENANQGSDTVEVGFSYTLGANVENLTLTGSSSINGTGNALNNALTGNGGSNILNGGAGADTMSGGAGNDIYIVDNASDTVVEGDTAGTDTVQASVSYALSDNVENLTLTGKASIDGSGNALDNTITGNAGNNTLDGGEGADTLSGGLGNDNYYVDSENDKVIENAASGIDSVISMISYTLENNVENLALTGSNDLSGTGNALNNAIIGNSGSNTLDGGLGNDTLDGGKGADSLVGGLGNDTYYVDNAGDIITEKKAEGTDSVLSSADEYTLADNVENLTLLGTGSIDGTGNDLNNILTGNSGNNRLDGGAGADRMTGGAGNDTYIVDNAGDVVVENANQGTDTVEVGFSYTLGANVENLTLTGSANINGTGNVLNNNITGNEGNNILDGGAGADTMTGGTGDDTYIVDNAADQVVEGDTVGTDTVKAGVSYALSDNVENLILTGIGKINGTGNDLANTITGNRGNNKMDGGLGADTLQGGLGNDTYVVDNAGDVVKENAASGTDTVLSSIDYTLNANVENLTLTGSEDSSGIGNALNNVLTGNGGNNKLDGWVGIDKMAGGKGNDTYVIDNVYDTVVENANEGNDTVEASVGYTLSANVENLTLTGTGNINGSGNTLDNTITGNSGSNILNGGTGADAMSGGAGNDIYIVDNASDTVVEGDTVGTDTVQASVSYVLSDNVERLTLTGTGSIDGTGNGLANTIIGNSGNNKLDGGLGADTLSGGLGNDAYVIDDIGDIVTENAAGGNDSVEADFSYILGANVENLTLTGTDNINGTGNALNNVLTGNNGSNTLTGGLGNDTLDGGKGADSLVGGAGNDTYVVDDIGDIVTENKNEGIDTVLSSINYTLGANVENLTLAGTENIDGTGNELSNVLIGNSGNNKLDGGFGIDTLVGGTGNDTYLVDNARDVVVEKASEGTDTIESSISYTLAANVENLVLTGTGALNGIGNVLNNTITGNEGINILDGGAGADTLAGGMGNDTYIVDNVADKVVENADEGSDTVKAGVSYTLADNVEILTLTGTGSIDGTGNKLDNTITGNNANNKLDGGLGADTLLGGKGNDTYVVDNAGDVVTENAAAGTDTVAAAINYILGNNVENLILTGSSDLIGVGNKLNNSITGNKGNNILDGSQGADTLIGGIGDDVYDVDNAADVVVEYADEGKDTVAASISYTLSANVEDLILYGNGNLTGIGNALDNTIEGREGNNILDGGLGADTLSGGTGNDTYVVDNSGDKVEEKAWEGTDTVKTSISYTLVDNVENLTLTGTGNIDGTGNELDNTITGNTANNKLDGGLGADTLLGGKGNDIYVVDNLGDKVVENAGEGTDTVTAAVSYTLTANIENLILTGTGNSNGTGNVLNNTITGTSGNNVLDGGLGVDAMSGGQGNDTYVVDNLGDKVVENADEGIDTVQTNISYTLGSNVENLTLTGTGSINGLGNAMDNTITGNSGNNTLDGGLGVDTLLGGIGNDTYMIDNTGDVVTEKAGEGIDSVISGFSYTLTANVENLSLTGAGNINGYGNELNNALTGNSGENILDGGAGADKMTGGAGNDKYIVDNVNDVVVENVNGGTDTVEASVSYTLSANVENLILTGTGNSNGIGNVLNNTITAGEGDNILDGGLGADTLSGGKGNDTYVVDNLGDKVVENAGEGTDTVQAGISYTLMDNVENLTLTGTGNINGTGNSLDNIILGNSGNNTLDGGLGTDTLVGGKGNDTYVIDDAGDVIVEKAGEGIDSVIAGISYTLLANFENLSLTGAGDIDGTGNELNNMLTGNSGNNILDGGRGADTLKGGAGNDKYIVDNAYDVVVENANEGIDTVEASVSYVLSANVENLTLTGTGNSNGTGNVLNNTITAGQGDNILDGGLGADTLSGGKGNDIYVVDNLGDKVVETTGEGIDTVKAGISYFLADNVENLTLTGAGNIDGTGNALDNTITGSNGNNILDGGLGADTLIGGKGNDTYVIDDAGDVIVEKAGEGIDCVIAGTRYTLLANFENLSLTGAGDIEGAGNELNNVLTGNSGNNILDGGKGADTLKGGAGNDKYVVDNAKDVVVENANEGIDTIEASGSYTLGANVENLDLTGTANINGTGNELNNTITGSDGNNILDGGLGADTLLGGLGNDTLYGGAGDDYIDGGLGSDVIYAGDGNDTVAYDITDTLVDGGAGIDVLDMSGVTEGLKVDISGSNVYRNFEGVSTGEGNDTITGSGSADFLLGGAGNDSIFGGDGKDTLNGGDDDDTLDGGNGNDVLIGGQGDNHYIGGAGDDLIILTADEGAINNLGYIRGGTGNDTLDASATTGIDFRINGNFQAWTQGIEQVIGSSYNDYLMAGGKATLIGGAGDDTLSVGHYYCSDTITYDGGIGSDTYLIGDGDVFTYTYDKGNDAGAIDTLDAQYRSTSIDLSRPGRLNLAQMGFESATGTDKNDYLIGGDGDQTICGGGSGGLGGDDTLDGGNGNDVLCVGHGPNSFIIGEKDLLLGGAGNDSLYGAQGNDTLVGGTGNDVLTGGSEVDTFVFAGDFGNDIITDYGNINSGTSADILDLSAFNFDSFQFKIQKADETNRKGDLIFTSGANSITLQSIHSSQTITAVFAGGITKELVCSSSGTFAGGWSWK